MSQSDYIKYKKTTAVFNDLSRNQPVLTQQTYIDGKQFSTALGISYYGKEYVNLMYPQNITTLFNMPLDVSSVCPINFMDCHDGSNPTRTNRVPMDSIYFTPNIVPTYVKHKPVRNLNCNCITNKKFSNSMFLNVKKCACKGI